MEFNPYVFIRDMEISQLYGEEINASSSKILEYFNDIFNKLEFVKSPNGIVYQFHLYREVYIFIINDHIRFNDNELYWLVREDYNILYDLEFNKNITILIKFFLKNFLMKSIGVDIKEFTIDFSRKKEYLSIF